MDTGVATALHGNVTGRPIRLWATRGGHGRIYTAGSNTSRGATLGKVAQWLQADVAKLHQLGGGAHTLTRRGGAHALMLTRRGQRHSPAATSFLVGHRRKIRQTPGKPARRVLAQFLCSRCPLDPATVTYPTGLPRLPHTHYLI
jgi:hypothetical protein